MCRWGCLILVFAIGCTNCGRKHVVNQNQNVDHGDANLKERLKSLAILRFPNLAPITSDKFNITVELIGNEWVVTIMPKSTDIVGGGGRCVFSKDEQLLRTEGFQ